MNASSDCRAVGSSENTGGKYSHLSNNRGGEAKIAKFTKRGDWNKCGGWKIFMKSINVEEGILFCGG